MFGELLIRVRCAIQALFHRARLDGEMDEELRAHIQNRADDLERSGLARSEAERRARLQFGGYQKFKEESREAMGMHFFETLAQDIRYAVRTLRKSPGFAAVAILTLALGIGANTAIFSVVQSVLLAPLPYAHPDQLVFLWQQNPTAKTAVTDVSYPDFLDWRRSARSFQRMAAVAWQSYDLTSPGEPEHVEGKQISSDFFAALGVKLAAGREFSIDEDRHGAMPVAIINNRLWTTRFAGSPDALGKALTLSGISYTIVGILPPGFRFDSPDAAVYTPLGQGDPLVFGDRTIHAIACIARLRPGVTFAQADGDIGAIQNGLNRLYPAADQGLGTSVTSLKQILVGDAGPTLFLLLGAVGIVLLIACANVANLLLARSAARTREFALRLALGARRARIVRQLLTESLLLSLVGGGLGLLAAKWGVKLVLAALPETLPHGENVGINLAVLSFAFAVSVAVGILFGLAPALKSSKTNLQSSLKEGGWGSTAGSHRSQSALVIVQTALTLVLLAGASLLFRTIQNLWEVNPGFDARNVITFRVGLSPASTQTGVATKNAYRQLLGRLREIPGVQAADLTVLVPLSQQENIGPFWVGSQKPESSAKAPRALFYWTGPDYLQALKIPLLRGRYFTPADTTESDRVVVIDSVLARAYFAGQDPIGKTMTIPHWGDARIVGVVGHVRHWSLDDHAQYTENQIYAPFYELHDAWVPLFYITVIVRTPRDAASIVPDLKAAVFAGGSDQTIYGIQTIQGFISQSLSAQRFPMVVLAAFAALALLLASIGIYGVISYLVARRANEIGIRFALGARPLDVFRLVIGNGLRLALAGIAIGAVGSLILARVLPSFTYLLYGVRSRDPFTLISASVLLIIVAFLACFIPARRAMRTDPMTALRHE